jgi:hypothetical protein
MDVRELVSQVIVLVPASLNGLPDASPDVWFKAAAAVILWVYMIVSAGRESDEA